MQTCHQEELQRRDEVAAIYAVALKANTPAPQMGYLAIARLSIDMRRANKRFENGPFIKHSHNHNGFQIKFYLFDLVAHFTALEISPSPLLSEDLLNFFPEAGTVKQGTVILFTLFTKADHSQLLISTAPSSNPLNNKSKLLKDLMCFGHCTYINSC